ncbi:MAG: glycosyltransferase [bacterium]|nr:glycosyltransferase [bacterium]
MRILYFGTYNPGYSRNRVLIKGLRANGLGVAECHVSAKDKFRYLKLVWQFLKSPKFDLMVVGFPGQEIMFLARFLTRKPIVFDAFTSHYGGYILDRQYFAKNSWRAKYYRFIDTWSCKLADLVLLDTNAHIDFFVKEFKLDRKKLLRVFVGTDSEVFYPREALKSMDKFLVHFHGHYIPLQGVKYIIEAAKLLENEKVHFNIIGNGQTFKNDLKLAERLSVNNVRFIDPVPYEELPILMSKADVCLGIFGDSPKTDLVIPNKIFEAMAMGKAIITADTLAVRELLNDRENVLFCRKADAKDLAEKIRLLKNSPEMRGSIGGAARKLFKERLTEDILIAELLKHIHEL